MSKTVPLYLTLCCASLSLPLQAGAADQAWRAIAFGQSTDMNFSSNVLPEKVGVNDVTIDGKILTPATLADLSKPITIESRGGKIANSHDGLTFFYTVVPATENFTLEATVTVEQFGPENSARPAAQEGAGLLVRDVIGVPRQAPLKEGYEEFPAAGNMVMNAIMTQDRKDKQRVKIQAITRQGINHPWGNVGSSITRDSYQEEVDLQKNPTFRMKLERTNSGFISAWSLPGSDQWVTRKTGPADLVNVQEPDQYYVGFFASRNAKITVSDARFTTSQAQTVTSPPYVAKPWPVVMQLASPAISTTTSYTVRARANYDGSFTVKQNEIAIGKPQQVRAGEFFSQPATLQENNQFTVTFAPADSTLKSVIKKQDVTLNARTVASTLYVSPEGRASNTGDPASPLDLNSALALLPAGGKIILAAGDYPRITLPVELSGDPGKLKTIDANGKAVIHGVLLDASYWHLRGIAITGKSLRIQGSHNVIENITAYHNDDTGIQISSPDKLGRPLWASYNRVLNSSSWQNEDPGKINADGFAVKMRVGDGNRLEGCYAWGNIDDGYDLFNKIEDGANGVVVIENSIARNNTSNGFKLGGEGQPVAHQIRNSIAIGNQLDGFTDNFNPGKLVVANNIAVDNQRFNYIFRAGPYNHAADQGMFSDNISLRSTPGKYDDALVGNIDASNYFIHEGKSINRAGNVLTASDYQSLALPQPLERNADGSFNTGDFMKKS